MMNLQGLADELNDLLASETRSLARHLDEAQPYLTPATYRAWNQIRHFGEASEEHAARLSALQERLDLVPQSRPYPPDVANYHYISLDALLPLLIREKQQQIARYERALQHAANLPDVQEELADLLSANREQLAVLQSLVKSPAATTV